MSLKALGSGCIGIDARVLISMFMNLWRLSAEGYKYDAPLVAHLSLLYSSHYSETRAAQKDSGPDMSDQPAKAPGQSGPGHSVPKLPVSISAVNVTATSLAAQHLNDFIAALSTHVAHVGISAAYGSFRRLEWLALCRADDSSASPAALVIHMNVTLSNTSESATRSRRLLAEFLNMLTLGGRRLIAYDADILATALFLECGIRLRHCFNVQSINVARKLGEREFTRTVLRLDGDKMSLASHQAFFNDRSKAVGRSESLLGRAWAAFEISFLEKSLVSKAQWIDTSGLTEDVRSDFPYFPLSWDSHSLA